MTTTIRSAQRAAIAAAIFFGLLPAAGAQPWASFATHSRYLAMGDSISAGYGAMPATQGFTYRLYGSGSIDSINNTLFCTMAVPGAMSQDVLDYQVPQARRFFPNTGQPYRKVITLTVGGNDLFQVLEGVDPTLILTRFGQNLWQILAGLRSQFPDALIYVANSYDPKLPVNGERELILALNNVTASVVASLNAPEVKVVDVFSAFEGRTGLLLSEKQGTDVGQSHPTNAGYLAIADAFSAAIRAR